MDPDVLKNKLLKIHQVNQMIFLHYKTVICISCVRTWLSPKLIEYENGLMCHECADKSPAQNSIPKVTKAYVSNLVFPCLHCDQYFGKYSLVMRHMKKCIYRRKKCIECDSFVNELEIWEHLRVRHQMEFRKINESAFDISMENFSNIVRFYCVEWSDQDSHKKFIVRIEKMSYLMLVDVYTDGPDAAYNVPFKVVYLNKESEKGTIAGMSPLFAEPPPRDGSVLLYMPPSHKTLDSLRLYFGFDGSNNAVSECPICMCNLTQKIYLCKNGHILCSNCFERVANCGMCRESAGISKLNLSTLLPNFKVSCANAERGCIYKFNSNQMDLHKNKCQYNPVTCDSCEKVLSQFMVPKHYMKSHPGEISNGNTIVSYYVSNDLVFRVEMQRFSFPMPRSYYNVRLLHDDTNRALSYRYEVQFFNDLTDTIMAECKIGAACQIATDTNFSSMISLDKIKGLKFRIFIIQNVK